MQRVDVDVAKAARSVSVVGAGGTGTSRSWLRVDGALDLFVKLPSPTLVERVFLTVFGVYDNELNFYRLLLEDEAVRDKVPHGLFARCYANRRRLGRFALCLEDLSQRPGIDFPSVKSPHPPGRVEAVLGGNAIDAQP